MIKRIFHRFATSRIDTLLFFFVLAGALYPFAETNSQVLINEVSSANFTGLADEDDDYEDWIELYNAGNFPVNLKDWVLTDNPDRPKKWRFPEILIQPKGYLLVFASGKDRKHIIARYETAVFNTDTFSYVNPSSEPDRFWRNPDFDDSDWLNGPGGFGHGEGFYNTKLYDTLMSVFFRKRFEIPNLADIGNAQLHVDYDDGYIAFMNGFEITRSNLRPDGKLPEYNQAAWRQHPSQWLNGEPAELFTINHDQIQHLFVEGENVLTMQLHNNWLDGQMSINPFLSFGLLSDTSYFRAPPEWFFADLLYLHTNFKLDVTGEPLMLFDSNGNLRDAIDIPEMRHDISYGRVTDGDDTLCFFENPTPDSSNNQQQCFAGIVQHLPKVSPEPGLYELAEGDSLMITLFSLCHDCTLRYTTDGSDPTNDSPVYENPIYLAQSTVIKARLFKEGYLPGNVSTASFILNKNTNLPIISISTHPDLLFSDEHGIYVMGPDASSTFPYFGANFWRDVEIPVDVEYFGTGDSRVFHQVTGMQIHGGWTRGFPQKSLRLIARGNFGASEFDYPFFKDKNILNYKKLILRNGGNDYQAAMMRDALMHKLVQNATNLPVQDYMPSVVYLNGEYWGIHNMREKIDRFFLYDNFALDDMEVDLLENNNLIIEGGNKDFIDLYNFIVANDMADEQYFHQAASEIDISNLIDYFVVELFVVNTDWPQNNVKYWRHGDRKWQYILLDLDNAMGFIYYLQNHTINSYTRILQDSIVHHSIIFQNLLENNSFKRDFINRYADLLNTVFLPENTIAMIDAIRDSINDEMVHHKDKWGGSASTWYNHHVNNRLKLFFNNRPKFAREHTVEVFQLDTIRTLCLQTKNGQGSRIRINSIIPKTYPWSGIYFYDNPVFIEALPAPGMEFSHWQVSGETVLLDSLPQMWWHMTGDDTLTAIFSGAPDTLKILITEINFESHQRFDAGDWIELFNPNEIPVDVSGWKLRGDSNFETFTFPDSAIISPGEYWVAAQDTVRFSALFQDFGNVSGPFGFGLKSWSSAVRLYDSHENLIAAVQYYNEAPWPENIAGSGRTIELINIDGCMNDPLNWKAGCLGGSPGRASEECREKFDVTFTEFNYRSHENWNTEDWAEIYNYDTATVDLSHWVFKDNNGSNRFHFPFGTKLDPGEFMVICQDTAAFRALNPDVQNVVGNFDFGLSSQHDMVRLYDPWENLVAMVDYTSFSPWPNNISGTGRTAEVIDHTADIKDPANWRTGCLGGSPGKFPLPCHDTAAIVVTEINYAASEMYDTGDWIEIFNHDTIPVFLDGWRFRDDNPNHNFDFPAGILLMPGEYLVLVEDSVRFSAVHDTVHSFIGEFDFGLSSIADEVHLYDLFNQQIAFISYQSAAPWPANIPGSGRTIELIDPGLPMNDPESWKAGCFGGTPGSGVIPCQGDYRIAITEFNYRSHPNFDTKDWVELFNYDTVPIDLSSWVFKDDQDDNILVFPAATQIMPGEFLIICQDSAAFRSFNPGVTAVTGNFNFGLSSQSDHLRLFDEHGNRLLLVEYSSSAPWPQDVSGTGRTVEIVDFTANLNDGANWRTGCLGGSPGTLPMPCHDTSALVVTEISFSTSAVFDTGTWIEILNNDSIPVSLKGWRMRDAFPIHNFYFPDEAVLMPGEYLVVVEDSVRFRSVHENFTGLTGEMGFTLSPHAGEVRLYDIFDQQIAYINYQTTAPWPENIPGSGRSIELIEPHFPPNNPLSWKAGCRGGSPGSAPVPCHDTLNVVITEVNYSPSDEFDTGTWFEIYNLDSIPVSLDGWWFRLQDENNIFHFPDGIELQPGQYFVVAEDSARFMAVHDSIMAFVGGFGSLLSDDVGEIYLYDLFDQQVAHVNYQSVEPWPEIEAGSGHTIHLIDPALDPTNPMNWKTGCPGGSPAHPFKECDDTRVDEIHPRHLNIAVYPNPFSQSFTINLTADQVLEVDIQLKNGLGRIVDKVFSGAINPGITSLKYQDVQLPPGIYLLQVATSEQVMVVKLVSY